MNLEQAKALFVAQYLGQKVVSHECDNRLFELTEISLTDLEVGLWGPLSCDTNTGLLWSDVIGIDICYLLLRTIDQLTDDEAAKLTYIALYHPTIDEYCEDDCWTSERDYNPDGSMWLNVGMRCWEGTLNMSPSFVFTLKDDEGKIETVYNQLGCIDYLRSIGILLPFTYLNESNQPITLPEHEIIKLGWAKIQP